jgi:hypothetical protein
VLVVLETLCLILLLIVCSCDHSLYSVRHELRDVVIALTLQSLTATLHAAGTTRTGKKDAALRRFFNEFKPVSTSGTETISAAAVKHALREREASSTSIAIAVIGGGLPAAGVRRDDPVDAAAADQSESAKQQQGAPTAAATAATASATDKQLTYEEFCALVQHRAHTVRDASRELTTTREQSSPCMPLTP